MKKSARGYSLIEVLIAMAILGTVLMSILTLFIFGRRNVYSGRQMTRATSVATHVIEDIQPLRAQQLYDTFNITSTTAIQPTLTVADVEYRSAIIRRMTDFTDTTKPGYVYFNRWTELIPPTLIQRGRVTLIFMPRDMETEPDPTTARRLLLRVVMEWEEASRQRQVFLETVKLNRNF